jgi:predicted negative regulator of RcsB-dependent stress response
MKKTYFFIIVMVLTVPLLFGINAWQANKCGELQREINRLQREQAEVTEKNREAIAGITELLATSTLENNVREIPGLKKMSPEDIVLIRITGGKGSGR